MTTKRTLHKQTKTFTIQPEKIPPHYITQISDLLKRYLHFDMAPEALIPYFSRAYSRFYLMTSADAKRVHGIAGTNVLTVDNVQLIYLGAVVVEAGFRGISTLYQPIYRDVLTRRIARPHQRSYLFGAIVNPYAYAAMARRFSTLYPSPAHPTLGTEMLDLTVSGLTELYGTKLDFDREQGLVRPTVAMAPVAEKPLDSHNDALNFYAARNPGYREGVGLIYAVPLTVGTLAGFWRRFRAPSR